MKGLEQRMIQSERSLSTLERVSRSRNIILFKLQDTDEINSHLNSVVINIFKKVKLQIPDVAIDDVFRIGKTKGNRPTMIKFISSKWVKMFFGKVGELKSENIFIANDRSKEERENRLILLDQVKKMREEGQNVVLKETKIVVLDEHVPEKKQLTIPTNITQMLTRSG